MKAIRYLDCFGCAATGALDFITIHDKSVPSVFARQSLYLSVRRSAIAH